MNARERPIRVLVVGGLTRLDSFYRAAPEAIEIETIFVDSPSLESRAEAADALVLVVGQISHPAAAKIRNVARRTGKPLAAATGPSLSRVRASIALAYVAVREASRPSLQRCSDRETAPRRDASRLRLSS